MRFKYLIILFVFVLVSCGTTKPVSSGIESPRISKSKLIKKNALHSFKNADFETVKINSKMAYEIGDSSHRLGMKIRIAKGEKLWMSADFLGIPVAKLLVERDSVYYYNKFDKTYFKGSFDFVKELTGVNVTYDVLENLFTGDLALKLGKGYKTVIRGNDYYLEDSSSKYDTSVEFYPFTFKTKSQSMRHSSGKNSLSAYYKSHQNIKDFMFPKDVEIKGSNKGKNSIISMTYTKVTFDEELNFPFKVPKECNKEIVLGPKDE